MKTIILSEGGAEALAAVVDGVLDDMGPENEPEDYLFWLQVMSQLDPENAEDWEKSLREEGII